MIPSGMSIQKLYGLYREGNLLVNRKYQRKLVWTEQEKADLIDTIMCGYPIPLVLLAERPSKYGPGKYEILDGVQRLNAIFSFIENYFAYKDKYFDVNLFLTAKQFAEEGLFSTANPEKIRLDGKQCANFLDYQLAVTTFSAFTEDQVTEIFGRINASGRQLSDQERRQAGVINTFGELVRQISAEIRGDASKEVLRLSEMPEISIETPRSKQSYGLKAEEIFWYKQGIISAKQLRESDDEEMIADILASVLLGDPFERSKNKFDELYNEESTLYKIINDRLISYPPERLYQEITQTFSVLREIIEEFSSTPNTLRSIASPGSRQPIKTSFYAIFMAFFDLLVKKEQSPVDAKNIMDSLKGLQSEMTATAKYTKSEDRRRNIDKTIGLIQKYFVYKEPPYLKQGPGLAIDFENSLRRSRMETPKYEFKQGLLELTSAKSFNNDLLNRIINTACAIANSDPQSEGYIYLGVADKKDDAEKIKALYGTNYIGINGHFIVGVDREIKFLGIKEDEYLNKIVRPIRNSSLTDPLKTQLLSKIDIISYKSLTVIRLKVPSQSNITFVGERTYIRQGNETMEAKATQIPAIIDLFKAR